jgi:GNAT superfamily N-acetyltransferase
MEVVQYHSDDLPEIIELMKGSLGEGLIPKSEAYFIWKHVKNPFGKSKILLAKEDGKIVGLRAFMKWQWESKTSTITAVRAVDTATDPAFQGKGIFKKLTLQAVEECKTENDGFVFNTPNTISIQGYLKMGWFSIGRMPLLIGPGSLIPRFYKEQFIEKIYEQYQSEKAIGSLPASWKVNPADVLMHTPINKTYLHWRYNDCPIVKYGTIIESGKFGIVFRLKKINRFIELRICEIWTEDDKMAGVAVKALRKLIRNIRPAMVSCAPSPLFASGKKKIPGLFGPVKKGPITTLRPLAIDKLNTFEQFYQWSPSIGSMELF